MSERVATRLGLWPKGMDSLLHPTVLDAQMYAYGMNVVNRGGIVQTRPGFSLVADLPGTNLQGFTLFTPKNSIPSAVVAIDGKIYHATYPYNNFVKIDGISFSPDAPQIVFQSCTKSVKRNKDESLSVVTPYEVLVIQDGINRAAYWDGTKGRHLDPSYPAIETPIGLWMSWTASRLWLSRGSRLYVSDIADPLSFSENSYIAERSSFELPGNITGMVQTADQRGLLVFTDTTTTSFRAEIRNRTQWQLTADFQRLVLPSIGCVAGKTPRNQYGITHWLSQSGLTTIDAALYAQRTAQVFTVDEQMMRSKRNISPDSSRACSIDFENFFLVSVPSGDVKNAHTWAMDRSPMGEPGGPESAWASVWTGVNPVEWASTNIAGRYRCFFASKGNSGKAGNFIHIWEAFRQDRTDDGGSVICQLETGGSLSENLMQFKYAEIEIVEMLGDVNLKAYVRGIRGPWVEIMDVDLTAEKGSIGSALQEIITQDSILESFKPQSRSIRTEELNSRGESCLVESKNIIGVDKAFFILLQWRGRMGVREIRVAATQFNQKDSGECTASETGVKAINDGGQRVE